MEVHYSPAANTFMLAVDHSPNSQYAFEELCKMLHKDRDIVYFITVSEYVRMSHLVYVHLILK